MLAIGSRDGCRISILKVHTDEFGSLIDMSLVAICYRGFRACNLKEISFSANLDHMIVTSDSGTVHLFDVRLAHEDRPINIVRNQEIRSFMKLKLEDLLLLKLCHMGFQPSHTEVPGLLSRASVFLLSAVCYRPLLLLITQHDSQYEHQY